MKISEGCRHVTAKHSFTWNFLDSIILCLTTTAEFAVISHEKVQEYEGDAGIQTQTDQRLTK